MTSRNSITPEVSCSSDGQAALCGRGKTSGVFFLKEIAMKKDKKGIDIGAIQDITVQLCNIATRMKLIEKLRTLSDGGKMDHIIMKTVGDIAADALRDLQTICMVLDEHIIVRKFITGGEFEVAFRYN